MSQLPRTAFTIAFLLAFLCGIAAGTFFEAPWQWLLGGATAAGAVGMLFRSFGTVLLWLLILAGMLLGFARFEMNEFMANEADLSFWNDGEEIVEIIGTVAEEPDRRMDHVKLTIEASELNGELITGRVLAKLARFPSYNYGDELRLRGHLKMPFETDEFSYRDYLARFGIRSVIYYPRVSQLSADHGNPIFAALYDWKFRFESKINQVFPEPGASFMAGLLTGSRRGIPEAVLADFNATGLTHIIAISGYNIALVIAFAVAVLGKYISRRWQFFAVAVFVIAFTLFVGAGPSVLRAAIMGLLAFFALTIGRQYHVGIAIVLTAASMVAWNPAILLTDVSFQLSFAAVLGLLFVAPHLEPWMTRVTERFAIRESLTLTLAAQVTAVPLIVFYFDRLSLISPLANVLVAPAIPLAMLTGLISTIAGWVYLPLGILLGFIPHLLLQYMLLVADWLAAIPFADVAVTGFGQTAVVLYYLSLVGWLVWKNTKKPAQN